MVVVNDATHLIDQGPVEVVVLSTRPTSQGVMVFAKLGEERERELVINETGYPSSKESAAQLT